MSLVLDQRKYFENDTSREYWGDEAAGCIIIAKDTGRVLLPKRSSQVQEPYTWGTWGGKIDAGENPKHAVAREVEEETGYDGVTKVTHLYTYQDGDFHYYNFAVIVPFEFTPQLNWETETSTWVEFGDWPEPMHFGLEELLSVAGTKIKSIINVIKKKRQKFGLKEDSMVPFIIKPEGLIDIDTYGYKIESPFSYLTYGVEPSSRVYTLRMVRTIRPEDLNKGHAREILDHFFQIMKKGNASALEIWSYTGSGMDYVKHVVERLAKQYGIRLI